VGGNNQKNWKKAPFGTIISLKAPKLQFGNNKTSDPLKPWQDPDIKNAMFQFFHPYKKLNI